MFSILSNALARPSFPYSYVSPPCWNATYGSLIGASANVVLAGISSKHGYPITFKAFLKVGFPIMIVSVVISTIYLVLRFGL